MAITRCGTVCKHFPFLLECERGGGGAYQPITNCEPRELNKIHMTWSDTQFKLSRFNTSSEDEVVSINIDKVRGLLPKFGQFPALTGYALRHNAHLLAFLFRPVDPIVRHFQDVWSNLGLDRRAYSAVHIRHTDKFGHDPILSTEQYIKCVMAELGKPSRKPEKRLYVMSDDPEAIRAFAACRRWHVVHKNEFRPSEGATENLRRDRKNAVVHAFEFMASVMIAIRSKYFIGTCTSAVDWGIAALQAAHWQTFDGSLHGNG
eukprot:NODE_1699_length_1089_cov_66.926923_g1384_i0.p1 GENE.NODE_1699_length_1089_cov_66.926923_g1384_i0~~NODE_1699_length_1089_cov_66.926923_g1384_i0.p1  ORF type:complete len:261 (-),score=40.46 NODE_1699_length_1089_cov_66.926923_g1384_i0:167-949(-)